MNTSGSIVAKYTYDAWGKVTAVKDASGNAITSSTHVANVNPIRYRGYYYDTESSLYYLQSRYYDPEVGRFLNADGYASTGQSFIGFNMFAYCGNDPTNFCDAGGAIRTYSVMETGTGGLTRSFLEQYKKTEEEAALAFANKLYSTSEYTKLELCAVITKVTVYGQTRYCLENQQVGSAHHCDPQAGDYPNATAFVHTHSNSNTLSRADRSYADRHGINVYAACPNGFLYGYNSETKTTSTGVRFSPEPISDAILNSAIMISFVQIWYDHLENGTCPDGFTNCGDGAWFRK